MSVRTVTTGYAYGCKRVSTQLRQNARRQLNTGKEEQSVGEDRDFYLSILHATQTKREARSYLQRFTPAAPPAVAAPRPSVALVAPQPVPAAAPATTTMAVAPEQLHVALVSLRDPASISDDVLHGVGRTLGQLKRLGLLAVVVVDAAGSRREAEAQADRVVAAIEAHRGVTARRVEGALTLSDTLGVTAPKLLLAPLGRGVIPVLAPTAYDAGQRAVAADPYDTVTALVSLLRGQPAVSLDRLIFLDPLGGIPAPDRPAGAHVFVNLQQEYASIASSLRDTHPHHLRALDTIRTALSQLPPTSSGVITTPAAAAAAQLPTRSKNPLIHNLLTDKPIFSSSLPTATSPSTQTTLLKHGTPLRIFPSGTPLTSPEIDLPKLVALIEDSFGKTLDVPHYLARVNERIAAVIIAGDYEGAAIVTWEHPPGASPTATKPVCYLDKFAVARRSQGVGGVADVVFKAMIATLDKEPGVDGVVWRSRRSNVVNKWYFERARGSYKLKEGGDCWTMFWTTRDGGVDAKMEAGRWGEYVAVCGGVEPSLRERVKAGG
ncbi:hypothetical protein EDC01DRAFT_788723 [Geopyxis carbonaria]|nr:hypothetical protein EDC01DRAFT_788723 [Geopyxis carbonaria]